MALKAKMKLSGGTASRDGCAKPKGKAAAARKLPAKLSGKRTYHG